MCAPAGPKVLMHIPAFPEVLVHIPAGPEVLVHIGMATEEVLDPYLVLFTMLAVLCHCLQCYHDNHEHPSLLAYHSCY